MTIMSVHSLATDKREARGREKMNGTELVVRVNRREGNEKEEDVAGVVIVFFTSTDFVHSLLLHTERKRIHCTQTILQRYLSSCLD